MQQNISGQDYVPMSFSDQSTVFVDNNNNLAYFTFTTRHPDGDRYRLNFANAMVQYPTLTGLIQNAAVHEFMVDMLVETPKGSTPNTTNRFLWSPVVQSTAGDIGIYIVERADSTDNTKIETVLNIKFTPAGAAKELAIIRSVEDMMAMPPVFAYDSEISHTFGSTAVGTNSGFSGAPNGLKDIGRGMLDTDILFAMNLVQMEPANAPYQGFPGGLFAYNYDLTVRSLSPNEVELINYTPDPRYPVPANELIGFALGAAGADRWTQIADVPPTPTSELPLLKDWSVGEYELPMGRDHPGVEMSNWIVNFGGDRPNFIHGNVYIPVPNSQATLSTNLGEFTVSFDVFFHAIDANSTKEMWVLSFSTSFNNVTSRVGVFIKGDKVFYRNSDTSDTPTDNPARV